MEARTMKVGEIFIEKRVTNGGIGYYYAPVCLEKVALVGMEKTSLENVPGAPTLQTFVFRCLQEGDAKIQLARLAVNASETIYEEVLPIHVAAAEAETDCCNTKHGGWSPFEVLTEEDMKVFEEIQSGLKGVDYTVFKVSKQVVNGMNYRFACTGKTVTAEPGTFPAIIKAHVSNEGKVTGVKVKRVLL